VKDDIKLVYEALQFGEPMDISEWVKKLGE